MQTILEIISSASLIIKLFLQLLLDGVAKDEKGNSPGYFRVRFFLPYYDQVPANLQYGKVICNIFYYIGMSGTVLFLIIEVVNKIYL